MSIKDVQAEFETRWATIYKAYRPLLDTKEGSSILSWISAVKGLAWNCYLQGRTDEMARQRAQGRQLTHSLLTAQLKRERKHAPRR